MMLNIMVPTEMAPMYSVLPRCPDIPVSISPSSGTVIFATMAGSAICIIDLFNCFADEFI